MERRANLLRPIKMNYSFYKHKQFPKSPSVAEQTLLIQAGFLEDLKPLRTGIIQIYDGRWFAAQHSMGYWLVTDLYPSRIKLLWALFRKTAHWQGI